MSGGGSGRGSSRSVLDHALLPAPPKDALEQRTARPTHQLRGSSAVGVIVSTSLKQLLVNIESWVWDECQGQR